MADRERLDEIHAEAVPLAAEIRALEAKLAAWCPKQDIRAELDEKRAKHKALVEEVAGILAPVEP